MSITKPDLSVTLGPLKLQNPLMTSSGTFGYGQEYSELFDLNSLGGIVVKGLSVNPKTGNPPPRIVETACGMLNAIGLANMGLKAFVEKIVPWLAELTTRVVVNIYGHTIDDYRAVAEGLKGIDAVSALEVNISCPNVECGGMVFGTDPKVAAQVTEQVLKIADKPVIVKLSPNVTDIRVMARAVEGAGAHVISLINAPTGMAVDIKTRRPKLANVSGGLTGPAIRPIALHMVHQVVRTVKIPVIGIGGIMNYQDALEFFIVGARAVQVGTANFINPRTALNIVEDLERYCIENGIAAITDIIGTLDLPPWK
ncbi:MAG: dihydroorotate dehydrogenase [Desulfobacterales bacterium]|nr:dihydroorotate dehydrogenase [Desulfobacterales bacterium]